MPSIRLRGTYSSLGDSPSTTPRIGPLSTVFIANAEATNPNPSTQPRIHRSMPTLHLEVPQPDATPEVPPRPMRPRSGTTNSRISSYIIGNSRHYARTVTSDSSSEIGFQSPLLSPRDALVTREGPQAEVAILEDGKQGVVESSLNLLDSEDGPVDDSLLDVHHDDIVDHLDVIDPQIGTISNLTNAANALIIPPNMWYSRKPVVQLNSPPTSERDNELGGQPSNSLEDTLDRHVDDVLQRPSKVRRTMMGVWSFLKTPMGVIVAIYGFCVVFWGAAIVFFLAKIINFHNANTQGFWVEVSSQVVNGLFCVTGIGLIPFRALDTYRIFWIWYYKYKTRRLRAKAGLPALYDEDDLPDPKYDPNYVHVLTDQEEKFLYRQQRKFSYSQTWYRPHGTETHRAFPIKYVVVISASSIYRLMTGMDYSQALTICLLNDANSCFQIILSGTMWGLDRFQRPAWSTGILIPAGFLSGITAAILIWRGGEKTKRVAEVQERLRAALTVSDDTGHTNLDQDVGFYPPARRRNVKRMSKLPENIEENEVKVEEEMTISIQAPERCS